MGSTCCATRATRSTCSSTSPEQLLEAELWFYGRVFGFAPADPIEPVEGAVGL